MNIYNMQQVKCSECGKFIGELDVNATIIFPLCSKCTKIVKKRKQKGIQKILVPIDVTKKSTNALDVAIYLSKHLGSKITLLQVIPPVSPGKISLMKDVFKEVQSVAKKSIKWAEKYCQNKNITPNNKIVRGEEAEQIVKTAKKQNYDLIIMGSSGKGVVKEIVFGSISNYVMHNSNVPVLTVKEKSKKLNAKLSKKYKRK